MVPWMTVASIYNLNDGSLFEQKQKARIALFLANTEELAQLKLF